ncbi:hypothetical protein D3C72_1800870 [compost metagenome]
MFGATSGLSVISAAAPGRIGVSLAIAHRFWLNRWRICAPAGTDVPADPYKTTYARDASSRYRDTPVKDTARSKEIPVAEPGYMA